MYDIIIAIVVLYLLYKLVFDFLVPVTKTASHFKSQVNQMRQMQEEQQRRQQQQQPPKPAAQTKPTTEKNTTTTDGEYIDYEEVK